MGKAKKVKVSKVDRAAKVPLAEQIEGDKTAKSRNRHKVRFRRDDDEEFVDANLSQKILSQARKQQLELQEEDEAGPTGKRSVTQLGPELSDDERLSSDDEVTGNEYYEDVKIDEEDERALQMFMDTSRPPARTLADIIMEKLTEKKTELDAQFSDVDSIQLQELDPRVKEMFEKVRDVLVHYRSGALPKAFKHIPSLRNWEQIVYILDPPRWSAAAMYAAVRLFASNLQENMAQRFYNLVLLPRIRDDLTEYKRLNFHLYQALRKALYKQSAFMKGIILPLLNSGTCTLREAVIVGSVIAKYKIKLETSAATILKIAEMDYTGANSIFLRILLAKGYALPYRVVDAVVFHFLRFERDHRELPVLWHQAFLTFAQKYKNHISSEQREALLQLLRKQSHHKITPEIRRELQHAKCADAEMQEPPAESTVS